MSPRHDWLLNSTCNLVRRAWHRVCQWAGVSRFFAELAIIAPAAGQGCHAFIDADGNSRGFVQFIIESPHRVTVHRLWTLRPGVGGGSLMLRELCRLADRHGMELELRPLPFGRKPHPLNREELRGWYRRHGFEGTGRKMLRKPSPQLPVEERPEPSNPVFFAPPPEGGQIDAEHRRGLIE